MVELTVQIQVLPLVSLHMRMFKDGETIHIEPWRSAAFPVIKDLVVDRSAFDRVMAAGGFVSVNTSGNTLMPTQFQFLKKMQIKQWMLQLVSDVELV
jgi:succinate dehydrogenase/fumarate reductase-like Fe-S protein